MEQQKKHYNPNIMLEEDFNIDLKKIFYALWNRRILIIKIFMSVFIFFILLTFVLPKKYTVDADLYINKTNSSNMAEINPYFISEVGVGGGMAAMLAGGGNLTNEMELMQSPLVIDKVIKENDLRFKKLFGIFPTVKTGQLMTAEKFLEKKVSFEIKKGTNVVTISYKNKDKELAYGVVNSIITNYIDLHKKLNTEKSKSDKAVLEAEYNKAKKNLNKKMNSFSGIPATAISGSSNISAMSAFSKKKKKAMSTIQGQYTTGVKSEIALREDSEKVAELARKLEWAKLVDNMSDSSNVVVLKEPQHLKDYEQDSPKLFINIILGVVFGVIAALIGVICAEIFDKKLAYSMLGENIIYDINKNFTAFCSDILTNIEHKIGFITFEEIPAGLKQKFSEFDNVDFINAEVSKKFVLQLKNIDKVVLFVKINRTNSQDYKVIKNMLENSNKEIISEVLL